MALVTVEENESDILLLYSKDRTEVDYASCSEAESTFSDIDIHRHNSIIRHVIFHNISYTVDQRDRCFRKLLPKKLLHHVR